MENKGQQVYPVSIFGEYCMKTFPSRKGTLKHGSDLTVHLHGRRGIHKTSKLQLGHKNLVLSVFTWISFD